MIDKLVTLLQLAYNMLIDSDANMKNRESLAATIKRILGEMDED